MDGNTFLEWVLEYHRRGWCIIPIRAGTKKAAVKWEKYQTKRPDEKQLQKWFGSGKYKSLAVVCGEVSRDLSCRDYDGEAGKAEYKIWVREHPELAKQLPTAQTADGYHVYFEGGVCIS